MLKKEKPVKIKKIELKEKVKTEYSFVTNS